MYTNNSQNQSQVDWSYPRRVIKKAMTKARPNQNGSGVNRGILIVDPETNQEKWITVDGNANQVIGLKFGSWCYYAGEGNRPSLTVQQPQINNTQPMADRYARQFDNLANQAKPNNYSSQANTLYDSIEQSYNPPNRQQYDIDSSYHSQPNTSQNGQPNTTDNTVDDSLIEKLSVVMSNCMNMSMSLNPQLSTDEQTRLAVSVFIQYNKIKADSPF